MLHQLNALRVTTMSSTERKKQGDTTKPSKKTFFNDSDVAAARARLEKVVPKQKYSRVEFLQMITVDVLAALDRGVELGQIEPELKKLNIEIPASFIAKARSMRKARALGPKRADAS